MRFSGKIYKNGKFWLAEMPILEFLNINDKYLP